MNVVVEMQRNFKKQKIKKSHIYVSLDVSGSFTMFVWSVTTYDADITRYTLIQATLMCRKFGVLVNYLHECSLRAI